MDRSRGSQRSLVRLHAGLFPVQNPCAPSQTPAQAPTQSPPSPGANLATCLSDYGKSAHLTEEELQALQSILGLIANKEVPTLQVLTRCHKYVNCLLRSVVNASLVSTGASLAQEATACDPAGCVTGPDHVLQVLQRHAQSIDAAGIAEVYEDCVQELVFSAIANSADASQVPSPPATSANSDQRHMVIRAYSLMIRQAVSSRNVIRAWLLDTRAAAPAQVADAFLRNLSDAAHQCRDILGGHKPCTVLGEALPRVFLKHQKNAAALCVATIFGVAMSLQMITPGGTPP